MSRGSPTLRHGLRARGPNALLDFPPERGEELPGLDLPGIFNCSFASDPEVLTAVGW